MSTEPWTLSIADQRRLMDERAISATELVESTLGRIHARDDLGAFVRVDDEGARAAAQTIDARVAAGDAVGPLAGIPIAVKDGIVTEGLETTAASRILRGWIPPYDATVVAKLRAAGAIIVGKTNMDEFAMGSSNENSSVGPCKNPWDLSRVPGGSSGGSAAATAAGLCAASLGTDTGGSIRQPAAFTGTVGFKPTYGRVSRYGVVAFASSLDQVGPITRSVADAALVTEVISGFDSADSTSIDTPVPRLSDLEAADLRGVRVGLPREYLAMEVDDATRAGWQAAVELMKAAGAELAEISLPHTEHAIPCYYLIAPAEASSNLARYDGVRFGQRTAEPGVSLLEMYKKTRGDGFGAEVKRRIMIGTFALRSGYYDAYYRKAQKVRALIARDFLEAFASVDLIASPTSPTVAFPLGARTGDPMAMYASDVFTLGCNLAGLPGLSVPCPPAEGRLPVGLQLIGPALGERAVLEAGYAIEREIGGFSLAQEIQ